jgi:chemotaxis protein MotB
LVVFIVTNLFLSCSLQQIFRQEGVIVRSGLPVSGSSVEEPVDTTLSALGDTNLPMNDYSKRRVPKAAMFGMNKKLKETSMKKSMFISAGLITLLFSCVSKSKLQTEQAHVKNLQSDSIGTHDLLNGCNSQVNLLKKDKASLEAGYQDLSSNSQAKIASSQLTIAEQAKRLRDLQNLIQMQKDIVNKLKKSVADALVNFKPDELTVTVKDGKLYVSLQEKLLFKSGSAVVDPKGKEALQSLATVLKSTPDIQVMIEGHTDIVPIKGKFEDNWALSVARATSIVRILTTDYNVDPHTIIASGRGEFFPVESNDTPEGKSRNRRTEIILSPNLSELFKLINQ